MPKSRVRKFFDRFSRKKKQEDVPMTPQEWVDVDDSFDARTVGADRGGWESFRDDSASYEADVNARAGYGEYSQDEYDDDYYDEDDSFYEDKTTALSRRLTMARAVAAAAVGTEAPSRASRWAMQTFAPKRKS